jgi:hypothetical protein
MVTTILQILSAAMTEGMLGTGRVVVQGTGSQTGHLLQLMMLTGAAVPHVSHGCQVMAGPVAEIEIGTGRALAAQTGVPCTDQTAAGSQNGRGMATAVAAAEANHIWIRTAAAIAEKGQTTG